MKDCKKTLIYQMYPSSWGTFRKMSEHLDRIAELKPDYIWLSPCFKSPWKDGGYDITDYYEIDPRFGTMKDFDNFVKKANKMGAGVLMDLVMNHTSTECEWFKKSEDCDPFYKGFYCWEYQDLGWNNLFDGKSAFKWSEKRCKYYLHLFHESQADLNWTNRSVLETFQKIIDFWTLGHGVAGFRLDASQFLWKEMSKTFVPKFAGATAGFLKYYQKPETLEILEKLFEGRGLFIFAEAGFLSRKKMKELAGKNRPIAAAENSMLLSIASRSKDPLGTLKKMWKKWGEEPEFVLATESHDLPRATSALEASPKRILRAMFRSPATIICLYQGQELGLENPKLSDNIKNYQDIQTIMRYDSLVKKGVGPKKAIEKLKPTARENARVPIDVQLYEEQRKNSKSIFSFTVNKLKRWRQC